MIARPLFVSILALTAAVVVVLPPHELVGQGAGTLYRPHADWQTVETDHFVVHFPAEARDWLEPVLARMEAMHGEVAALVGRAPAQRVTVLVADPVNLANGFAVSLMDAPLTTLWPTPPGPRAGLGALRRWGELLFVHEYAHLAHLTFPSRNRLERLAWRLLPVHLGPLARRSPRWVREGYATYVEGRLTGSGRPHGATRPAFLRQRALEGRLPSYAEMSGGSGYGDMASAYLVGSAFLEWLVAREGEESLNHLWRRMSARERRSFSQAFSGVYGGPPAELYGLFTVELTRKALQARNLLEAGGLEEGELWQMRRWGTGEPALSRDGTRMAVVLHREGEAGTLVVWDTEEDEGAAERRREARERLLERDPLDVPATRWRPPPPRTVATLSPVNGREHVAPRFLPDGERILTIRWEPVGDGTHRPDLFVWNVESGELRRVTHGEAIRSADPSPDGTEAVGIRCRWGSCDVVRVDLGSGEVRELAPGTPERVYYRPRWAPDGESVVASVQEGGRWRLVSLGLGDDGGRTYLDPDDGANRYDAAFLPDRSGIVTVSDLNGVPNLELLDPANRTVRPLTRVLGEVAAPAPHPEDGSIFFLSMHSRGWDLRRIHPDSSRVGAGTPLPEELWPVARHVPPVPPDTFFAARPVAEARPYGTGFAHQRVRVIPGGGLDAGGGSLRVSMASSDPVGRLGVLVQGAVGDREVWTGASASLVVRRLPLPLRAEGFLGRQHPSGAPELTEPLDVRMAGGLVSVEGAHELGHGELGVRVGGVGARVRGPVLGGVTRALGFGELRGALRQVRGGWQTHQGLRVLGEKGRTGHGRWDRVQVWGELGAGISGSSVDLTLGWGRQGGPGDFEAFRVGGGGSGLFDPVALAQQVDMPALPPLTLEGHRLGLARVSFTARGWEPYFWVASTDRHLSQWHRVAGIEQRIRMSPAPALGLPDMTFRWGVGRSLDEPFEDRTRFYFSVGVRP